MFNVDQSAITNKGNCYFAERDYQKAKLKYEEALGIDASCVEALYNLGLTYSKIGLFEQALDQFFKLHAMQPSNTQIYCKIAETNEKKSDYGQAENWYMQALRAHPKDSELLKSIGNIFDEQGDRSQAFQYYHDVSQLKVFIFSSLIGNISYFMLCFFLGVSL